MLKLVQKIESWIQQWLKHNAIEKLLSLMLVIMIVFGFTIRELYKKVIVGYKETNAYLTKELADCRRGHDIKDAKIEALNKEFIKYLMENKREILHNIDSVKSLN